MYIHYYYRVNKNLVKMGSPFHQKMHRPLGKTSGFPMVTHAPKAGYLYNQYTLSSSFTTSS
jgi:hypothetical protein